MGNICQFNNLKQVNGIFFYKIKFFVRNFFEKSESQRSGIQNRSIPKGFLSEYQHSYLKQDKTNKIIKNRAKDTWSFESKSLLNEPFLLSNDNGSQNLRAEKFPTVYKRFKLKFQRI